jgi:ribonucleotide reductase alpha subunit
MKAYDMGCKGITFYRDGSRDAVLTRVADEKKKEGSQAVMPKSPAVMPDRPTMLQGYTYRIQTPVGKGYVTINHDEAGNPFEVFITVSRAGSDIHADADAIGRLISLALRMPTLMEKSKVVEEIIDKLRGIGGGSAIGFGNGRVRSLADAIAKVLLEHMTMYRAKQGEVLAVADNLPSTQIESKDQKTLFEGVLGTEVVERDLCNQCGQASLVREEGCMKCYSCGYSKC